MSVSSDPTGRLCILDVAIKDKDIRLIWFYAPSDHLWNFIDKNVLVDKFRNGHSRDFVSLK